MKLLLISLGGTPTTFGNCEGSSYKYGNTSLEYLASYLRENYEFPIDTLFLNKPLIEKNYLDVIDSNYDICGIFVDIAYFDKAISIYNYMKEHNPNVVTFSFGRVSSNCTKVLLDKCPALDYAILGDPEEVVAELIDSIINKSVLSSHRSIATHTDMDNKKWAVYNADINRWPCFDYYQAGKCDENNRKIHCLSTKCDMCSGECSFCWSRKQPVVYKDVERIFSEIEYVSRTYKIKNFYFIDNNLFDYNNKGNKERLLSLFKKIKELNRNLLFTALVNADSVTNEDEDLYLLMKEIGFYSLFLGVDTGNEQDIRMYKKRATLKDNLNALDILRKVGIWVRFGYIFYNPFSSLDTIKENYNYLCKIKSPNIYHYGALRMIVFEKTLFKKTVCDAGLLGDNYSGLDIYNYRFNDERCYEYYAFISKKVIPLLEKTVSTQYLKLKKNYEMARVVNRLVTEKYTRKINRIEKTEFNIIRKYFYHLYIENDLDYCKENLDNFIGLLKSNAISNDILSKELETIWTLAPMEKE